MCFSPPKPSPTNQVVSQTIPAYIEEASKKNIAIADDIGSREYTPYPSQRLAGFNQDTNKSFDMVRDAAGAWQPDFAAATGATKDILNTPTGAAGIKSYMDPYAQAAMEPTLREMGRQVDIGRLGVGRRAQAASAYGGSRHGVVEGEYNKNAGQMMTDTIAQQMSQAYQHGANLYGADRNQRLQGVNLLANLTGAGQKMQLTDASALAGTGAQQQALEQMGLDLGYRDFIEQRDWPVELLNIRTAALSGSPYARTNTTQGETMLPNTTAQNLGALAALTGGVGSLGGSQGVGGLVNLFK